jgi:hypothetical protein
VAEGADGETADLGLTELEHRHISELHELAAAAGVPRFRTLRRAELAEAINAAIQSEVAPPTPPQGTAQASVFVVIRLDKGSRWTPSPKPEQVNVEKIVSSESEAEQETERLNSDAQAAQTGATYFWRAAPS